MAARSAKPPTPAMRRYRRFSISSLREGFRYSMLEITRGSRIVEPRRNPRTNSYTIVRKGNFMKYRKLVARDLEVSEISLGSWLTYGVGVARENAVACVDRAFEPGINFIDTANVYGRGAAETFLGEVLASRHVDLYQCHRYDSGTPIEETMQALSKVVRDGKARYIGFSEWSPQQVEGAGAVAGTERFVSSQPQYSLLWRKPEEAVIPLCAAEEISQIVWSPLAQGVLSGKYLANAKPPT